MSTWGRTQGKKAAKMHVEMLGQQLESLKSKLIIKDQQVKHLRRQTISLRIMVLPDETLCDTDQGGELTQEVDEELLVQEAMGSGDETDDLDSPIEAGTPVEASVLDQLSSLVGDFDVTILNDRVTSLSEPPPPPPPTLLARPAQPTESFGILSGCVPSLPVAEKKKRPSIVVSGQKTAFMVVDPACPGVPVYQMKMDDDKKRALTSRPGYSGTQFNSAQRAPPASQNMTDLSRPLISTQADFLIERAPSLIDDRIETLYHVENVGSYDHYFARKQHVNAVARDPVLGTILLSVKREVVTLKDEYDNLIDSPVFRCILRTKRGDDRVIVPATLILDQRDHLGTAPRLLNVVRPDLDFTHTSFTVIDGPVIRQKLVEFERTEVVSQFKFGVMLQKSGDKQEEDMFGHKSGGADYEHFLTLLGHQIRLKKWKDYAGGLDTKRDTTGKYSVYVPHQGCKVMFHVATMLPHSKKDKQQLEKKRHLGNDIGLVVFQEDEDCAPFVPEWISSHFIHVCIVVRVSARAPDGRACEYRVSVANRDGVSDYRPVLPPNGVVPAEKLRELLLAKLVNGELATYRSPRFASKFQRVRVALLNDMYSDFAQLG